MGICCLLIGKAVKLVSRKISTADCILCTVQYNYYVLYCVNFMFEIQNPDVFWLIASLPSRLLNETNCTCIQQHNVQQKQSKTLSVGVKKLCDALKNSCSSSKAGLNKIMFDGLRIVVGLTGLLPNE